jgi:hypothetical protein
MTSFLNSLKADLLDRRLLPLVIVVVLALVGAIGFVVLGGSSASSGPAGSLGASTVRPPSGLVVSQVTPEKAVAETTGGASQRHNKGVSGNPFTPLPQPKEKKELAKSTSSTTSSSTSTSKPTESSTGSSEPSMPAPAPHAPAKPKPVYHVAVLFGVALPAGAPEGEQALTPYENLKLLTPLPSAAQPLIVYRGVTAGGKFAAFTLVSEPFLKGQGKCLPSEEQCQAIELAPGQAEAFEYVPATGSPVIYELQVVSITSSQGSTSTVGSILRGESKAGRELLKHEGLVALPGLRYSAQQGVLVLARHRAFKAHAHKR